MPETLPREIRLDAGPVRQQPRRPRGASRARSLDRFPDRCRRGHRFTLLHWGLGTGRSRSGCRHPPLRSARLSGPTHLSTAVPTTARAASRCEHDPHANRVAQRPPERPRAVRLHGIPARSFAWPQGPVARPRSHRSEVAALRGDHAELIVVRWSRRWNAAAASVTALPRTPVASLVQDATGEA